MGSPRGKVVQVDHRALQILTSKPKQAVIAGAYEYAVLDW
jgi:hypothetical protein